MSLTTIALFVVSILVAIITSYLFGKAVFNERQRKDKMSLPIIAMIGIIIPGLLVLANPIFNIPLFIIFYTIGYRIAKIAPVSEVS